MQSLPEDSQYRTKTLETIDTVTKIAELDRFKVETQKEVDKHNQIMSAGSKDSVGTIAASPNSEAGKASESTMTTESEVMTTNPSPAEKMPPISSPESMK